MDPIIVGKIVGTAAYMALEYWLGKTDKVKAGSVVGIVFEALKYFKPKSSEAPK